MSESRGTRTRPIQTATTLHNSVPCRPASGQRPHALKKPDVSGWSARSGTVLVRSHEPGSHRLPRPDCSAAPRRARSPRMKKGMDLVLSELVHTWFSATWTTLRQARARRSAAAARAVLLAIVVALTGCAPSLLDNPAREANRQLPKYFGPPSSGATQSLAQRQWRTFFADPKLKALISTALQHNRELGVRMQEIVVARAEVLAASGELRPRVAGVAAAGGERVAEDTSQGRADARSGLPPTLADLRFGLRASWEIDVWGRLRAGVKAAVLRGQASVEARNFVITQVVAEIARTYYELAALDAQIRVIEEMVVLQTSALKMLRAEKQAARSNQLAVLRFKADLLNNKARGYALRRTRVSTNNRLFLLLGGFPKPVVPTSGALDGPLPRTLDTGLPTALLTNRPDVRRAELELSAAKLDVKATRARFYPSVSIDADLGYRSFNPLHLLSTPASVAWGLTGGLLAPLLNRRAIEAAYRTANARQVSAVLTFEQTVLRAFTEVATVIGQMAALRQRDELLRQRAAALQKAADTAALLFKSARADYREVLMARREWLDARLERIETRLRLRQGLVSLYQALGGGWRRQSATAVKR